MDLTSGENQSGSAVNENGSVRTDQGIPIRSDLGSTDLSIYSSAQAGLSTARPRKSCESDHKGAHRFVPRVIKSSGLADLELDTLMCLITALMGSTDE
ncbi:hypothetical protein Taro_016706 [Colocasia esculenta]|uniref:Uncharacterized protein n=1 Tax=Colocasia esculenta TaxID=4460 RepID=A0A843UL37_COLES|nr:hypothetical protein [Colocasia esculenta]